MASDLGAVRELVADAAAAQRALADSVARARLPADAARLWARHFGSSCVASHPRGEVGLSGLGPTDGTYAKGVRFDTVVLAPHLTLSPLPSPLTGRAHAASLASFLAALVAAYPRHPWSPRARAALARHIDADASGLVEADEVATFCAGHGSLGEAVASFFAARRTRSEHGSSGGSGREEATGDEENGHGGKRATATGVAVGAVDEDGRCVGWRARSWESRGRTVGGLRRNERCLR